MNDAVETFEVPADMVEDVKIAAQVLRAKILQDRGTDLEITVIEGDTAGFTGVEIGMALLSVPVAGLSILSKKWLEEVVWPELKPKLKKPTKAMLAYLFALVGAEGGESKHA